MAAAEATASEGLGFMVFPENPRKVSTIPGTHDWPDRLNCTSDVQIIEDWLVVASAREYDSDGFTHSVINSTDVGDLQEKFQTAIDTEFGSDRDSWVVVNAAQNPLDDQKNMAHTVTVVVPALEGSQSARRLLGGAGEGSCRVGGCSGPRCVA